MEKEFIKKITGSHIVVHAAFLLVIALCAAWVYSVSGGSYLSSRESAVMERGNMGMNHGDMEEMIEDMPHPAAESKASPLAVADKDAAVRAYLDAAQVLAEVYKFNNKDSYAGLCERSEDLYTLEGESGGILKYIKFVGATEVYCATSNTQYLIEAKQPENGLFYCIDHTGVPVEQKETREGNMTCAL